MKQLLFGRRLLSSFCLILVPAGLWAQTLTKRIYEGAISTTIPITVTLTQDGTTVVGAVVYKKKGIPITVVGKMEEGGLYLHELMKDGSVTGVYSLSSKGGGWTGTWSAPERNAKERPIFLKELSKTSLRASAVSDVTGTYAYSFGEEAGSGEVLVEQISPGKIRLAANAVTGGPAYNIATIEKTTLSLKGNRAIYENSDFGTCKMQFTFSDGVVQVDYLEGAFDCGFGHNATAAGNYIRIKSGKPVFETR